MSAVDCKYKLVKHGWKVPIVSYRASGMWKSILTGKSDFEKWVQLQVHKDDDKLWSLNSKGCFSVKSFHKVLIGENLQEK